MQSPRYNELVNILNSNILQWIKITNLLRYIHVGLFIIQWNNIYIGVPIFQVSVCILTIDYTKPEFMLTS